MISFDTLCGGSAGISGHEKYLNFNSTRRASSCRLSLFSRKAFINSLRYRFSRNIFSGEAKGAEVEKDSKVQRNFGDEDDQGGKARGISGIHVPRQKYIPVSKTELLRAILEMFEVKEDADNFTKLSVCLDSILHAEHKGILEEMRSYYSSYLQDQPWETTSGWHDVAPNGSMGTDGKETNFPSILEDGKLLDNLNLGRFFESLSSGKDDRKFSLDSPRIAVATRFQQCFIKLLRNAQFEELSVQDLLLTNALNSDYILTLPIYVDWKRASKSHAIIFRHSKVPIGRKF